MTPKFPEQFFVAYKLFTGGSFPPNGTWGDILDGPVTDEEELIDKIVEAFKDCAAGPNASALAVWYVDPYDPEQDCTEWALNAVEYKLHVDEPEAYR